MLAPPFIVKVTVYIPGSKYVWFGFEAVDVLLITSPKVQLSLVEPLETSANITVKGAQPEVGVALIAATCACAKLTVRISPTIRASSFLFNWWCLRLPDYFTKCFCKFFSFWYK